MSLSARFARRTAAGAAAIGAMLIASPLAQADQPNCTAADLAQVSSGVSAATSSYLWAHPDVNAFFTSLKGQPTDMIRDDVDNYMNANPQVRDELHAIRQPLVDLRERCHAVQ
jgi:heme-binding protein